MKKIRNITRAMTCLLVLVLAASAVTAATWVPIPTSPGQPVDTLFGVGAYYRTAYSDTDAFYSCAAYVKRYYQNLYNVGIAGLGQNGTPCVTSGNADIAVTTTPRTGDIYFLSTSPHSAIVKRVEGTEAVLIEQNYKWNGQASFERRVPIATSRFYRVTFRKPVITIDAPTTLASGSWMTIRIGTNLRGTRADILIIDANSRIQRVFLQGRVVNALSFTWSFDGRSCIQGAYAPLPRGVYRIYVRMATSTGAWTSVVKYFQIV